jgi:hypothetical protein
MLTKSFEIWHRGLVWVRGCLGRNLVNIRKKIEMAVKGSLLLVDHHGDHKVGSIVFILGENITKYKDMPYGRLISLFNDHLFALAFRLAKPGRAIWKKRG